MNLIPIDKLIEILKEKKISLGKGNPYNRLRYYTKLGLIPHMVRKKNENGKIIGHYPHTAIDEILKIEKMKAENKSLDEIKKELKTNSYSGILKQLSIIKKINFNLIIIIIITISFSYEILKSTSPQEENKINLQKEVELPYNKKNIIDSGISFIEKNQKTAFIPISKINSQSIVVANFYNNIGFNNSYFIKEIKPGQGFYIETYYNVPVESKFSWIVIE